MRRAHFAQQLDRRGSRRTGCDNIVYKDNGFTGKVDAGAYPQSAFRVLLPRRRVLSARLLGGKRPLPQRGGSGKRKRGGDPLREQLRLVIAALVPVEHTDGDKCDKIRHPGVQSLR